MEGTQPCGGHTAMNKGEKGKRVTTEAQLIPQGGFLYDKLCSPTHKTVKWDEWKLTFSISLLFKQ